MALGTVTLGDEQGQTTMRPNGIARMSIVGDGAYPTGGTLAFAATTLRAALGRDVEVTQVVGYGFTAGAITHVAHYVDSTDALQVFVESTGAEAAGAANLSGVTFDLCVFYR